MMVALMIMLFCSAIVLNRVQRQTPLTRG